MSAAKSVPLTKDEVQILINLVEENVAVTSKITNASNNIKKERAWLSITESFNSAITSGPRKPEQLRLKWENLKKAARKRSAKIRINNIKTGGGKSECIPPDDNLEKVAKILGTTCHGYTVPFGGDSNISADPNINVELIETNEAFYSQENMISNGINNPVIIDNETTATVDENVPNYSNINILTQNHTETPRKFFFPPSGSGSVAKHKRKMNEEEAKARIKRNNSISDYYTSKKRMVDLEIINKEISNKKLQLEIENLKLENEKLKSLINKKS